MKEWAIFTNSEKLNIFQKFAGEIRFGPEYIFLKSEPRISELENKLFGNWFYRVETGIFLQEWNSIETPNTSLVYIDYEKQNYLIIEQHIKSIAWTMKQDSEFYYLNFNYNHIELKISKEWLKKNCR